jgi:hypothetical protein
MDPRVPARAARPLLRPEGAPHEPPSSGVLSELARGFLLGLREDDPAAAARFASQFLRDQTGASAETVPIRPRTVRGPLPRASPEGRMPGPPGGD